MVVPNPPKLMCMIKLWEMTTQVAYNGHFPIGREGDYFFLNVHCKQPVTYSKLLVFQMYIYTFVRGTSVNQLKHSWHSWMIWLEVDESNEKILCGAAPRHFTYNIIAMLYQDRSGGHPWVYGILTAPMSFSTAPLKKGEKQTCFYYKW